MSLDPQEPLEFNQETLEAILTSGKSALTSSQYAILKNAIEKLFWFQEKGLPVTRLARIFLGQSTEDLQSLTETIASFDENSSCETKG